MLIGRLGVLKSSPWLLSKHKQTKDMGNKQPQYVRFDWAMKRLLRDKANFGVLEGFLTTLLNKRIKIRKLLESESNQEDEDDKQNRVDVLAEDEKGELYLIEVQNESETAYFQRMLFGTSKLVTEYINRGQNYENIRKIYSVNIVYFNLGGGSDVVYHGKTEFRGIHNNELLSLSPFQKQKFKVEAVSDLYPEYYILKVNDFNRWSKVPLDQWIYFLSTADIPHDATAPGLSEARHMLQIDKMSPAERAAYYHHLDNAVILKDNIDTACGEGMIEGLEKGLEKGRAEGLEKGRAEGLEKGRAEEKKSVARNLKALGLDVHSISSATGLSEEEINNL